MCWPFIVLKTWLTGDQQSEGYWVRIGEPCTAIQYLRIQRQYPVSLRVEMVVDDALNN